MPVTILIGEPLHPQPRDKHDAVNAELHKRLQELLDQAQQEYPEKPKDDELWWQPAHLGGTAPTPEEAEALDANGRED